jgi:hypothetical protein
VLGAFVMCGAGPGVYARKETHGAAR